MRPYECVSVWGVGPQIHKFPKMNHVQRIWGSGILKHTHIIFFSLFWTPYEAVWCCANNGQLDNSLDIYALTYYLNYYHSEFCLATLCLHGNTMSLLLLSSNFHVFPKELEKNSPHPRALFILSRPLPSWSRSHCRQTWISQRSETSHENAFPALRTSMVVRMLTMPTTSDDGHIFGKVSGRYIGPTFLILSERRMAQLALV